MNCYRRTFCSGLHKSLTTAGISSWRSLELSFKASLANRSIPITYGKHNLEYLEKQLVQHGDVEFEEIRPDATTEELFDQMYRRKIRNFDLQKFRDHQEALEMLVCYKYAPDLKYGIDKHGNNFLAVAPATSTMNRRFLRHISIARRHFPDQGPDGRKVVEFISHLESRFRDGRFRGASALIH
jgi:hypothetical protein